MQSHTSTITTVQKSKDILKYRQEARLAFEQFVRVKSAMKKYKEKNRSVRSRKA
jgi:hypothetical protein